MPDEPTSPAASPGSPPGSPPATGVTSPASGALPASGRSLSDAAGSRGASIAAGAGDASSRMLPEVDASLYLHPQTLARLGSMELRARIIIEGLSSGMHRSPFQGFSVEFAQHRPYVAGDDLRHLDWKVFGRTDKLQLKQYQQETNLDLLVLVDSSGSMNYGSRAFADASGVGRDTSLDGRTNWTKYDHATALAAALSYITLHQGDRTGLIVFADSIRAEVRRTGTHAAWRQVVGALSTHPLDPANASRPTDLMRAVEQMLAQVTNRCLVAIVSDFIMDIERVREALARVRHARHDCIAFCVMDKQELEFDFHDAAPFVGLEGEPVLRLDPRALKSGYLKAMKEHLAGLEKAVKGFGFDFRLVNTHDWLGPPLAAFVARRNADIKRSKFG
ncbi:MAG: DUF58 domain-containing protein [Planctomycetota bacterium]|nr:DUF58 domain-containing protein [Planctomycetota bacterium]